jgi:hypothetical protein
MHESEVFSCSQIESSSVIYAAVNASQKKIS